MDKKAFKALWDREAEKQKVSERNWWACDHCRSGMLNDQVVKPVSSPGTVMHLMCPDCLEAFNASGLAKAAEWRTNPEGVQHWWTFTREDAGNE